MSTPESLQANKRSTATNAVRHAGDVPAVMYGHGVKTQSVQVPLKAFTSVLEKAGETSLVALDIDGEKHTVLIRDVQYHPVRSTILHIDFYRVKMDEAIEATVPLRFTGVSIAIKDLSGVLVKNHDELKIKALPMDLPHDIEVDISSITGFDEPIRISDLKLPKGVQMLHEAEEVVTLVQAPRSEEELEKLSEEVKEDVEAVEGIKKEEPAAEGEAAADGDKAKTEPKKEADSKVS